MPASAPLVREIRSLQAKLYRTSTKGIDASVLDAMASGRRQMKENVSNQLVAQFA